MTSPYPPADPSSRRNSAGRSSSDGAASDGPARDGLASNASADIGLGHRLSRHRVVAGIWRRRWLVAATTLAVIGGAALAERNNPGPASGVKPRSAALRIAPTSRPAADVPKLEAAIAAARAKLAAAQVVVERAKAAIESDPARAAKVKQLILTRGYEPLPTTDLDKLLADITRTEAEINASRGELPPTHPKMRRADEWLDTLLAGYRVVAERDEADATARVTHALGALARASEPDPLAAATDAPAEYVDAPRTTDRLTAAAALVARSGLIGLLLGLTGAAALELLDRRFRSPAHVLKTTGLRVIGTIPAALAPAGGKVGPVIDRAAFRTARGVLSTICGGPVDERSGVLLVASALPEEGRSTLAVATAAALASVGERVALLDADADRPVQHHRLNLPEIGGLAAALQDPDSVQMFMRTSHIDGFDLLPHGKRSDARSSSEFRKKLAGPAMKELIAKLRETYTYVVVDAGPLLLSQEARLVAAQCDAAVLVLHADESRPRHAAVAHALLKRMGLPIVGAIVSALPEDYRRSTFQSASNAAPGASPNQPSRRRSPALLPAPDDDADEHELHLA